MLIARSRGLYVQQIAINYSEHIMGTTGIDSYVCISVASRGGINLANQVSKILTGERKVALAA